MIDLTTSYLGLTLKNPLVVSASPLGAEPSARWSGRRRRGRRR